MTRRDARDGPIVAHPGRSIVGPSGGVRIRAEDHGTDNGGNSSPCVGVPWKTRSMLELATGSGLAMAAGVNAWIPLLLLGLLSRFSDLLTLPGGWQWLENPWVMAILGVLLVVEMAADKIPALDSVNDVLQTVVRPTAGGIAFGAGSASETTTVQDPQAFFEGGEWITVVVGIVLALVVHAAKTGGRVITNTVSGGTAAPVMSTMEDAAAVGVSFLGITLPFLMIPVLILFVIGLVLIVRGVRKQRRLKQIDEAYGTV